MPACTCFHTGDPDTTDEELEHEYQNLAELHRKTVASAFWNGEVEGEWRDHNPDFVFRTAQDRELFMDVVDRKRAVTTYEHAHCSEKCKKRGKHALLSSSFIMLALTL